MSFLKGVCEWMSFRMFADSSSGDTETKVTFISWLMKATSSKNLETSVQSEFITIITSNKWFFCKDARWYWSKGLLRIGSVVRDTFTSLFIPVVYIWCVIRSTV